jgi:hypothetical protein
MARAEGIDEKKMRAAAIIGQFVKDQPANNIKATADELLGTHLQAASSQAGCPMESEEAAAQRKAIVMKPIRHVHVHNR